MSAFTVALLAHGDIAHSLDIEQWPYDFNIGIEDGRSRLPEGEGWQRVLQTNRVLAPQRVNNRARPPRLR